MLWAENRYQPPQPTFELVQRRRLLHQLMGGKAHRVTTIVAPAGFGKTSLAAQWYSALADGEAKKVWVTLGPEHRDQAQFLSSLIYGLELSLDRADPVSDVSSLSVAALSGILASRIRECGGPLWLFLEDYHFAQCDPIEAAVARILADSTTANLRLVIISRSRPRFPVSALRLADQIRQIDWRDLRFSPLEAQELLGGTQVKLTSEHVAELTSRTDGWAVALQMVRLLIREQSSGSDVLAHFSQSSAEMGLYLSEQVLSTLPEQVSRFLLATAPLPELSPDLAVAITGLEEARTIFYDLDGYALPLVHVDGNRQWLRLHPVFRDYLMAEAARSGLKSSDVLADAAGWFAERGNIEAAFRHALLASRPDLAAGFLEQAGGWRLVYASSGEGMSLFQALLSEVAALDLNDFPLSTLGLAVISAKAGHQDAANHYLALVERNRPAKDQDLLRQIRVVRALLSLYADRRLDPVELTELENDLTLDRHLGMVHRGLLLNLLSFNFLDRAQLDRTLVYGELSLRCLRDAGAHFGALHLHCHIGQAALFAGNIASAEESYRRLIGDAEASMGQGSDLEAIGQVLLAELETVRGDVAGAAALLERALPHVERHDTWFDILAAGLIAGQRLALINGDTRSGHALLDAMRHTAQRRNMPRLKHLCDTEQLRLLIASGEVQEAARFARRVQLPRAAAHDRAGNTFALRLRGSSPALLWIRLWLASGEFSDARYTLDRLRSMQSEKPHVLRQIELEALEIRLLLAEGEAGLAAERLSALVFSVPLLDYRGAVFVEGPEFLEALSKLAGRPDVSAVVRERVGLLREGTPAAPGKAAHFEPPAALVDLTGREQAILRLLSTGVTNKDIGRRLDMTDNTVKFHLKNIFSKLGVRTRTGAIAAARELGLLV